MKYTAYPEYTSASTEHLQDFPSRWKVSKVKYVAKYLNGYPFKPSDWSDNGKEIIRIQNLTNSRDTKANYYQGEIDKKYLIKTGDILLSWSATLALFEWQRNDGWLNQHIFKVTPNDSLVQRQFYIWIAHWFLTNMDKESHGSTMQHVTKDKFGSFAIPLPPLDEQTTIANFLDQETAKIDTLISKQQKLISLLQEKRQAVISHAVTKGINPDTKMKDSGVEWLGKVPEHWALVRGRFLFHKFQRPPLMEDKIVTAYRDGEVTLRENRRTDGYTLAIKEHGYQRVYVGDLVVHGMDAFAGAIGVSDSIGKCTPEYAVLRPTNPFHQVGYFAYCLRLMSKRNYIYVICPSVRERAPRFRFSKLKDVYLPIPSIKEQAAIVNFILNEVTKMEMLMHKSHEAISLLTERRTALISAAVTGKIDVKNA